MIKYIIWSNLFKNRSTDWDSLFFSQKEQKDEEIFLIWEIFYLNKIINKLKLKNLESGISSDYKVTCKCFSIQDNFHWKGFNDEFFETG